MHDLDVLLCCPNYTQTLFLILISLTELRQNLKVVSGIWASEYRYIVDLDLYRLNVDLSVNSSPKTIITKLSLGLNSDHNQVDHPIFGQSKYKLPINLEFPLETSSTQP